MKRYASLMALVVLALAPSIAPAVASVEPGTTDVIAPAPAPAWFNDDVAAAARAAAENGLLYEVHADAATGLPTGGIPVAPDYLFIRPGALFLGPKPPGPGGLQVSTSYTICTYNFIYNDSTQIGTAGHCVRDVGEAVYILAAPTPPVVAFVGTVHSFSKVTPNNDWALIDILAQWRDFVDPNVAYVGGPSCSVWSGTVGSNTLIKHVGHGVTTGLVAGVPRVGKLNVADGQFLGATAIASGGDSGSPLLVANDGRPGCEFGSALGILTGGPGGCNPICTQVYGTDIRMVPATVTTGFALPSGGTNAQTASAADVVDACAFASLGVGFCGFHCPPDSLVLVFKVGLGTAGARCDNVSAASCNTAGTFACVDVGLHAGSGVQGGCSATQVGVFGCLAISTLAIQARDLAELCLCEASPAPPQLV